MDTTDTHVIEGSWAVHCRMFDMIKSILHIMDMNTRQKLGNLMTYRYGDVNIMQTFFQEVYSSYPTLTVVHRSAEFQT